MIQKKQWASVHNLKLTIDELLNYKKQDAEWLQIYRIWRNWECGMQEAKNPGESHFPYLLGGALWILNIRRLPRVLQAFGDLANKGTVWAIGNTDALEPDQTRSSRTMNNFSLRSI